MACFPLKLSRNFWASRRIPMIRPVHLPASCRFTPPAHCMDEFKGKGLQH